MLSVAVYMFIKLDRRAAEHLSYRLICLLVIITGVRSIVPMIHLTWNLVRTIKIVNETLYQQLR